MRLVTLLSCLLLSLCLQAKDEYIIEETPGSKKLNVSRLEVSPGTTLGELLELFPELLYREGDDQLDIYDLQVNGISTGISAETVIAQLLARDIESITVSQSPSMTQQVKGQGAVINVTLKNPEEGFSGSAALEAGTLAYAMPSASFNYKKDKLLLRGSLMMEYYHPFHNCSSETWIQGDELISSRSDTCRRDYGYELARLQLDYNPDNRNSLKAWAWQSWSKDCRNTDTESLTPLIYKSESDRTTSGFSMTAGARYGHEFLSSSLSTQLEYSYIPTREDYSNRVFPSVIDQSCSNSISRHNIGGVTSYTYHFSPADTVRNCNLSLGLNYSYAPALVSYREQETYKEDAALDSRTSQLLLSPYIEASGLLGPVTLNGGFRYQYVNMSVKVEKGDTYDMPSPDYTAFFKLGWQIKPHHYLNTVLDRSVNRPDPRQMYPCTYYDPSIRRYVKGNEELRPMSLYSASLNYINDFNKGGHSLVTSATVQYIKANDIICNTYSLDYNSYVNDGCSDILSANAMLHYSYGVLSINFTGNIFQNWTHIQGSNDSYFNFNLGLIPVLTFRENWRISTKLSYYSRVITQTISLSDYFYGQFNVSKTWGKWTVYAKYQDLFHKTAEDSIMEGLVYHSKSYNLRNPNFLLGFVVSF